MTLLISEININLHGKQIQQVNYQKLNIKGLIKIHDIIDMHMRCASCVYPV